MLTPGEFGRAYISPPVSEPSKTSEVKAFQNVLNITHKTTHPAAPAKDPGPVQSGGLEMRGPENGIATYPVEPGGPWPYQIYRSTPFGFETNDELRAQRSATPQLDLQPFGNRPAASEWADHGLQAGEKIIVLDEVRLNFLEKQRELLRNVMPTVSTDSQATRQQEQLDELTGSVVDEIDYATAFQAVPDFEATAGNIRARAPNDPIYQRAIDNAKVRMEAGWKAEGRTPDQIGKLIEAGKAGDYDKVRELAKGQFIDAANGLGPDAKSAEIGAAILARAGVYTTYAGGDEQFLTAIKQGAGDASTELLIERPINEVLDIAKAGGPDWADKSIAKLREVTDPQTATPKQVLAIMGDARIKHLVEQSLRQADTLDAPEQGSIPAFKDEDYHAFVDGSQILEDLSAIYSATLYADGDAPGKGKQLVDEMAGFIVDNTREYEVTRTSAEPGARVGESINTAFFEAARDGNIALALAVSAKAKGTDNPAFPDETLPDNAVQGGITANRMDIDALKEEIGKDAAFLANPLESVGAKHLSDQDRTALIDKMLADTDPETVKSLNDKLAKLQSMLEIREPTQFALDAYAPQLKGSSGYDKSVKAIAEIEKLPPLPTAPGAPTNTLWLARCSRLFAATIVTQLIAKNTPAAVGQFLVGVDAADNKGGLRVLDRVSRGVSAVLFYENMKFVATSELIDRLYIPLHGFMATHELFKAVLPDRWKAFLFGKDANGNALTPQRRALAANEAWLNNPNAWINKLHAGDKTKDLIRGIAARGLMDTLDAGYLLFDGYNTIAYLTGVSRGGDRDYVRAFAYALATASDGAFLMGTGLSSAGAMSAGSAMGMGAVGWTAVGAVLVLAASGINFTKGRYDNGHQFDEETSKAWEFLGVNPDIADKLGKGGTWADKDQVQGAGIFIADAFHRAGYTPQQMVDFINRWTPEQADDIASHVKGEIDLDEMGDAFQEKDYKLMEDYAQQGGIPYPVAA